MPNSRKITFLSFSEVLEIHLDQLARHGGEPGIRDIGLLKSVLGMPRATFYSEFLHPSVFEMAAAYIFHIVKNHPFIDGNKRVGAVAGLVFLALNGYDFDAPEDKFADMIISVAVGEVSKSELSVFVRRWASRS